MKFLLPSPMDVHTICLIDESTLYYVLAFYLLWNIFFFSSRCLSRSCDLFPLRRLSRSGREGVLSLEAYLTIFTKKDNLEIYF